MSIKWELSLISGLMGMDLDDDCFDDMDIYSIEYIKEQLLYWNDVIDKKLSERK